VKDAESGQRGYLITDEPSYLQAYDRAGNEISKHIQQLITLTRDNAYQQASIPVLENLIQQRLATSKRTISFAQAGKLNEARQIVASNLGLRQMEQVQNLIADMRKHEEQLLAQRSQISRRGVQEAGFGFSVAWLFAIAFIVAFFVAMQREMLER